MVFKCKMCGGTLEFKSGDTVATCDSCGTLQTLPKMDDEHRMNLYDRANHYRRANEFDKAMGIYEQILNEDRTDAESYWSLVLCRYGIEYVEDPHSHKRVPTVNRAQYTSIYDDADYKSALQYATAEQKKVYEEEAEKINEIQKGILAISQKEEPFDVFICYKETDANGRRTQDSVLANDLYHQLTQEGFKVFFSRITLEDKLGTAYEPYIFAALNSAKVMVVLGTKEEYFNAVWVKNEWSRFLALIRDGKKKILIPAYRDMDPYDLPEEFSHLQAQDMSKLGFMQDLIRGIKKLVGVERKQQVELEGEPSGNVQNDIEPLLIRTAMFLEDENWEKADEYAERILDMNPKCAQAYLDKMMAEYRVHSSDELMMGHYAEVTVSDSFKRFMKYASEEQRDKTNEILYSIQENENFESIYEEANEIFEGAGKYYGEMATLNDYNSAKEMYGSILEYRDSKERFEECDNRINNIIEQKYKELEKKYVAASTIVEYESVLSKMQAIAKYKDVSEMMQECKSDIVYLRAKQLMLFGPRSNLEKARSLFEELNGYRDSNEKILEVDKEIEHLKVKKNIKVFLVVAFMIFCLLGVLNCK